MDKPPVYVVISYCPLLIGPTWPMHNLKSEDAEALAKTIDGLPSGMAKGCLWVNNHGNFAPVLLFDNASAIYEHLVCWSENKPEEWFEFVVKEKDDRYAIVCFPQLQKSIDRWKINFQLHTGFPVHPEATYSLLFKPLTFISLNTGTFGSIKNKLRRNLSVGLLNWTKDSAPNPSDIDFESIQWIKLPQAKDQTKYDQYLTEIFG